MATREEAIQAIKDYPSIDKKIHDRREEIEYPYKGDVDDNIGGGRAENVRDESLEKTVAKLVDDDPTLSYLYAEEKAVRKALSKCVKKGIRSLIDDATYDIIYEFYLRENRVYNVEQIAEKVNLSRRAVYKHRDAFIEEVRINLNQSAQ